jgi:hypothetical protein
VVTTSNRTKATAEAYQDFRGGVKLQAASAVRATVAKALRVGKAACHAYNFTAIPAFAVSLAFTLSHQIFRTDFQDQIAADRPSKVLRL